MEELNALLQPYNAPVTSERGTIGYQWDTTADRGMIKTMQIENASITTAKIQSYSFNQGTGGTLTLGGTANGNGVMNVLGSTGATAVTIDNSGITVTDGNIVVQNSGGTNIIDSNGLVSVNNFQFGTAGASPTQQYTGTAVQSVPNGTITFNMIRSTNILLNLTTQLSFGPTDGTSIAAGRGLFTIYYNEAPLFPEILIDSSYNPPYNMYENVITKTYSTTFVQNVPSGAGTLSFKIQLNSGTPFSTVLQKFNMSYLSLGA